MNNAGCFYAFFGVEIELPLFPFKRQSQHTKTEAKKTQRQIHWWMLQSNVDLFSLVWKEKCPSWLYIAPLSSQLLAFSSSFFSRLPFQTWWLDYNDHFQCERHGDYRWWRLLEKQIFFIFLRCLPFICNNGVWNKKPAICLHIQYQRFSTTLP